MIRPDDTKQFIITELERSRALLDNVQDPHYAVHEVRKCFKKIRSYLRLIRDQINFKEQNEFFRDLAMEISELRDLSSSLEASGVSEDKSIPSTLFNDL